MSKPYDDLNEALYNAAMAARGKYNNNEEAITLVYEKDGKFYYPDAYSTAPETGHTRGEFKVPKGAIVRALAHNHPEGNQNERFSDDDVQQATALNVPSAIVFGPDKQEPTIKTFTPGKTSTQPYPGFKLPKRVFSKGDAFDYISPVEVTQQRAPANDSIKQALVASLLNGANQ